MIPTTLKKQGPNVGLYYDYIKAWGCILIFFFVEK